MGNQGSVTAAAKPCHNQPCSADFILPPLSILAFRPERVADEAAAGAAPAQEKGPAMPEDTSAIANVVGTRTSFSPHPNPLPRGEGTTQPVPRKSEAARFADQRPTVPPLPKGEGRGEGKATAENAQVP